MTESLGLRVHGCCTLRRTYTYARHSEGALATEESLGWLMEGNDALSQALLSFSRSARESHGWLRRGNDNVLLCASIGDPRFARMTEERATLPRPLLGVCP